MVPVREHSVSLHLVSLGWRSSSTGYLRLKQQMETNPLKPLFCVVWETALSYIHHDCEQTAPWNITHGCECRVPGTTERVVFPFLPRDLSQGEENRSCVDSFFNSKHHLRAPSMFLLH